MKSSEHSYFDDYHILGIFNTNYEDDHLERGSIISQIKEKYRMYILDSKIYPIKIEDDYGDSKFDKSDPEYRYIHIRKTKPNEFKIKVYDIYDQGEMEFITEFRNLENLLEFLIRCVQTMKKLREILKTSIFHYTYLDLSNSRKTELVLTSEMRVRGIHLLRSITFLTLKELINMKNKQRKKKFLFFGEEIENPIWFI